MAGSIRFGTEKTGGCGRIYTDLAEFIKICLPATQRDGEYGHGCILPCYGKPIEFKWQPIGSFAGLGVD